LPPIEDLVAESQRIASMATTRSMPLKLVGGLAVHSLAPSSRGAPLARSYKDIDLALPFRARAQVTELMVEAGYEPNRPFNALNGHTRLMFFDTLHGRQVDLFVDRMQLCHVIDLRSRFDHEGPTLTPADLLLSKLQVVQATRNDLLDLSALLADLPLVEGGDDGIDSRYICRLAGDDWGLWKTLTLSLERVGAFAASDLAGWEPAGTVAARVAALAGALEERPKTLRWKTRSLVGERVRWYDLPEERH
jgi:hypothetical protein